MSELREKIAQLLWENLYGENIKWEKENASMFLEDADAILSLMREEDGAPWQRVTPETVIHGPWWASDGERVWGFWNNTIWLASEHPSATAVKFWKQAAPIPAPPFPEPPHE